MDGLLVAGQPRFVYKSGVSSTRRAARSTAIGTPDLIQRQFGNGGIIFLLCEMERLELDR